MAEMILVKVAPLGSSVKEVLIPMGSTVSQAISAAKIDTGSRDIRKNGMAVSGTDIVFNGDILTIIPQIKGGI